MRPPLLAPVHREGWIFVGLFFICALLLNQLSGFLGVLGFILTGWCLYFFRDPQRVTPTREGLVVSPADGLIVSIIKVTPPSELGLKEGAWQRISVFLDVFDVHINRIPMDGRIKKSIYYPGKFFNASLDKASEFNERQSLVLEVKKDREIAFVQIAGLIARRIRCDVQENQQVQTGERYGLIRFGSRVDIYLPEETPVFVIEGQRVIGGESIIADFNSTESSRSGAIR
ncbi:MAG: phosphatidylserine decarboxylase [Candidatus Paracaedimonas acanthamoebae]|uniref:Phosphatidylserine decarboxylase proenzyme n=1 Tax=Candidatus Paracaedimonas acanthamoebae TaxID=244581 RepID=A0A8J7PIY8_9PROT|nr:phosphatidylserine decarboxylase [Candidatus Paracaedimonas acanthamoebae]